jgi:uncharacterized membrane protein
MGSVDDIGEATVRILSRTFYYMVGLLILLIKVFRSAGKWGGENIRAYPLFERRNIERKDFVVLKAQVATLLILGGSVGYVFGFLGAIVLVVLFALGAYSLYLTSAELREHFKPDYHAYRIFFLSYFAISLLLIVVRIIKPAVNFGFPQFHLLVVSTVSVVGASYLFKQRYARDYTFGRVTKDGDFMSVKVNYDLLSSVKPGVHVFENKTGAKEGDIVKLLVQSSGLNLQGSRVVGVLREE